jgi:hypothetical protein
VQDDSSSAPFLVRSESGTEWWYAAADLDPAAPAPTALPAVTCLGADGPGVLAIDGKTLRRSFDRAAGRSALHVVTAFGADARLRSSTVPARI